MLCMQKLLKNICTLNLFFMSLFSGNQKKQSNRLFTELCLPPPPRPWEDILFWSVFFVVCVIPCEHNKF